MIRIRHGVTPGAKADEHLDYLRRTGRVGYKVMPGDRPRILLRVNPAVNMCRLRPFSGALGSGG